MQIWLCLTDGFTIEKGSGTGITGGISGTGLTCYIVNEGVEELLEAYVNAPNSVRINQVLKWLPCFENNGNIDIPVPQILMESRIKCGCWCYNIGSITGWFIHAGI